MLEITI